MTKPETDPTAQAGVTDTLRERLKTTANAVDLLDSGSRYTMSMRRATKAILLEAEAALAAQPAQTTEAVGRRGGFETDYGHFTDGEEVIYIDPNGKKWQGVLGEVLPDGEADFVAAEWSRGGTYKWRFFRKLPATLAPAPPSTGAEPVGWQWRQARGHIWRDPGFGGMRTLEWYQARPGAYVVRFLYAAPQEQVSEREAVIEECVKIAESLEAEYNRAAESCDGVSRTGRLHRANGLHHLISILRDPKAFAEQLTLARPRTTGGQG